MQPPELDDEDINPDNDEDNHTQYKRLEPSNEEHQFDHRKQGLTYTKVKENKQRVFTDQDIVPYNEYLTLNYGTHICISMSLGKRRASISSSICLKVCFRCEK